MVISLDFARTHLNRLDAHAQIAAALSDGDSEELVLDTFDVASGRVRGVAYLLSVGHDFGETPEKAALRAFVDGTDRDVLLDTLCSISYTFGESGPWPHSGYTPGTWDQVRHAFMDGLLSAAEYTRVREYAQTQAPRRI